MRTKVGLSNVSQFGNVQGLRTWTVKCAGEKAQSRVYFEFAVPPNAVEKDADTKVLDDVCSGVQRLAKSGLHLCLINSKQISGWQPDNPRWPQWSKNVDRIVNATRDAGGEAFHLSAANEAEITEKFGEIAEMMTD